MKHFVLFIYIIYGSVASAFGQDIKFNDTVSVHLKIGAKRLSRDSAIRYAKANFKDTSVTLNNFQFGEDSQFYLSKENILMKIYLNKKSKTKGIAGKMKSNMDTWNKLYPSPYNYTYIYKNGIDSVLVSYSKIDDLDLYDFLYFINNSNQYVVAYLYFYSAQKQYADRLLKELAKGVLIFHMVELNGY